MLALVVIVLLPVVLELILASNRPTAPAPLPP